MTRFAALLALDTRLLLKRPLFRTVAAASLLASIVAVVLSGGQAGGGWWRLAQAVRVIVPLLLSFGAILGAVSLAGDAASGSLRGVMMQPVSRSALVASRATVLAIGVGGVYVVSVLAALLLSVLLDRFGSITYGTDELAPDLISRDELLRSSVRLVAIALPALLCSVLIGLMVSSWWDDPSSSTICALLLVLSPYVVETVFGAPTHWAFTHGATLGATVFSELAEGVTTKLGLVSSASTILPALLMPVGVGALAVGVGCLVFSARDFRG